MPYTLTCVCPSEPASKRLFDEQFVQQLMRLSGATTHYWLHEHCALELTGIAEKPSDAALQSLMYKAPVDWCITPDTDRRKQLLISDMDSTIIMQECIDELADMHGLGAQVAAITERAMQGELDFSDSLRERVALLQGMPIDTLEQVWKERITLSPGAAILIATMNAHGAHTMLVSGGFTFFTEKVAAAIGFDTHHANVLCDDNGILTGRTRPPVLDAVAKREHLERACANIAITAAQSCAIGDGANDLCMIEAAGLGVAYHAKPVVQHASDTAINHTDLTSLLYFQGYKRAEWVIPS